MQVVLFCGGFGVRMKSYANQKLHNNKDNNIPKPLVQIGSRPLIWHIMKYYSFFGHNNFILALGYKAEEFYKYFDNYQKGKTNLLNDDEKKWEITLVDTGLNSNIGQRLLKVKKYINNDVFLANYTDGLTDLNLDSIISEFKNNKNAIASFMSYNPTLQFHTTIIDTDGSVISIDPPRKIKDLWINAGYFIFTRKIFEYINEGEELVEEPLNRLCQEKKLLTHKYSGFWRNIDNYKVLLNIHELYNSGQSPWTLWDKKR